MLTKQNLYGERAPRDRAQEGKGTQENFSAMCLAVSGFMVMELVSGFS